MNDTPTPTPGATPYRFALKTADNLIVVRESHEIDMNSRFVMSPMWTGVPSWRPEAYAERRLEADDVPKNFMHFRRYERTGEFHEGIPVFREVAETSDLRAALEEALDVLRDLKRYGKAPMYPDGPCISDNDWQPLCDVITKLEALTPKS